MQDNTLYTVRKIEQSEDGRFTVFAQDANESKKKRRKIQCSVTDPTSFYVGQKVRAVLEDAS